MTHSHNIFFRMMVKRMANETALTPEYIFITYDGVVKNYRPALIKYVLENYKRQYESFINIPFLEKLDMQELLGLCIQSSSQNIFEYLATREFDYDATLDAAYNRYTHLFDDSPLLIVGESIRVLTMQSFTKKIYIYSDTFDERIFKDINTEFVDMSKIEYISGPFYDVMSDIPEHITSFMLNDIDYVDMLISLGRVEYTNILLANYGFNYKMGEIDGKPSLELKIPDIEQVAKREKFKFVMFSVSNNYKLVTNYKAGNN